MTKILVTTVCIVLFFEFFIAPVARKQAEEREFLTAFGTTTQDQAAQLAVNYELNILTSACEANKHQEAFGDKINPGLWSLKLQANLAQKKGFEVPAMTLEFLESRGITM